MNKIKEILSALKSFFTKHKDIIMPTVIMVAISFVVILALSLTNKLTSPIIEKLDKQNQMDSMQKVLKAESYEKLTLYYSGEETAVYHIAKNKNKIIGYIFVTEENGYGGAVSVMTAITPDGKIKSVYVLDVAEETPGLGQLAASKDFYSQFSGLKDRISLVKSEPDKDKNEIKALTGATVTSKAVTRAVNKALDYSEKILRNNDDKGGNLNEK